MQKAVEITSSETLMTGCRRPRVLIRNQAFIIFILGRCLSSDGTLVAFLVYYGVVGFLGRESPARTSSGWEMLDKVSFRKSQDIYASGAKHSTSGSEI